MLTNILFSGVFFSRVKQKWRGENASVKTEGNRCFSKWRWYPESIEGSGRPWCRPQGNQAWHSRSPRTQYPGAPRCIQLDHQNHPEKERVEGLLAHDDMHINMADSYPASDRFGAGHLGTMHSDSCVSALLGHWLHHWLSSGDMFCCSLLGLLRFPVFTLPTSHQHFPYCIFFRVRDTRTGSLPLCNRGHLKVSHLAGVLATLQQSNAHHVVSDLSWVSIFTLSLSQDWNFQALKEIREVICEDTEKKVRMQLENQEVQLVQRLGGI